MTAAIAPEPVPLYADEAGGLRIGGTRVLLESLVAAFQRGDAPEEIREQYPTVALADIYAVLTFYLRHGVEVQDYLAERERVGDAVQSRVEADLPADGLRARLLARLDT